MVYTGWNITYKCPLCSEIILGLPKESPDSLMDSTIRDLMDFKHLHPLMIDGRKEWVCRKCFDTVIEYRENLHEELETNWNEYLGEFKESHKKKGK